MIDHHMRCACGSEQFSSLTTNYRPTGNVLNRIRGCANATVAGICDECGTHVSTVLVNIRKES